MFVRALLVIILTLCVLFIWRAGRRFPSLSILAGAIAALLGMLLIRNPVLAGIGVLALMALIFLPSRPAGPRK